jgi:hypothetical protein
MNQRPFGSAVISGIGAADELPAHAVSESFNVSDI